MLEKRNAEISNRMRYSSEISVAQPSRTGACGGIWDAAWERGAPSRNCRVTHDTRILMCDVVCVML